MIIRENEDEFLLINQHDHALISEQMITKLRTEFFPENDWKDSVLYAIKMHDFGWINFDAEPFWNDEKQAPYSFIDYPNKIKTVLYKHGIDEVAKEDVYAGLLCSKHFAFFLAHDSALESAKFVANEKERQRIIHEKMDLDEALVAFHFELLKFADDLSLFLCLHEPGAGKEETHYFFEKGIRVPQALEGKLGERLHFEWLDRETIQCIDSPFQSNFSVSIPFKAVAKTAIREQGLRKSYQEAEEKSYLITVQ